jgi:undecaprenyl-diphosphatase
MAVFLIASSVSGLVLSLVLKNAFDRPRPSLVPHLSHVYTSSFPSGHSMLSAVVYLTLATLVASVVKRPLLKVYVLLLGMSLTLVVGISRVYLGVHYPTDVVAGWIAGLFWALTCSAIAHRMQRRGKLEKDVPVGIDQ